MRTALNISHPGDLLARLLTRPDNDVTEETLLGYITQSQLDGLLRGEISIDQKLASELESATGVTATFWISRQRDHDHQKAEQCSS